MKWGHARQPDRTAPKIKAIKAVKSYAVDKAIGNSANNAAIIIKITAINAAPVYMYNIITMITMTSIIILIIIITIIIIIIPTIIIIIIPANFRAQ